MDLKVLGLVLAIGVSGCVGSDGARNNIKESSRAIPQKGTEKATKKMTFINGISVKKIQDSIQTCFYERENSVIKSLARQVGVIDSYRMYETYKIDTNSQDPILYPSQIATKWLSFGARDEQVDFYQFIDSPPSQTVSQVGLFLPHSIQLQTNRNEIFPFVSYGTVLNKGLTDPYGVTRLDTVIVDDLSIQYELSNASSLKLFNVETGVASQLSINAAMYMDCLTDQLSNH